MKQRFFTVAVTFVLLLPTSVLPQLDAALPYDTLYLMDGTTVEGEILDVVRGHFVRIQTSDGAIHVFTESSIDRIVSAGESPEEPPPSGPTVIQREKPAIVQLRDGSLIPGIVQEYVPGDHVTIRTSDGILFTFQAAEVERVTYDLSLESKSPPQAPEPRPHTSIFRNPRAHQRRSKVTPLIMMAAGGAVAAIGAILYQGEDEAVFGETGIELRESNREWTIPMMAAGGVFVIAGTIALVVVSHIDDSSESERSDNLRIGYGSARLTYQW